MKSDYALAEDHILSVAENLTIKETIHIATLMLTRAAHINKDKRSRRMIEILADDVQKLEGEKFSE